MRPAAMQEYQRALELAPQLDGRASRLRPARRPRRRRGRRLLSPRHRRAPRRRLRHRAQPVRPRRAAAAAPATRAREETRQWIAVLSDYLHVPARRATRSDDDRRAGPCSATMAWRATVPIGARHSRSTQRAVQCTPGPSASACGSTPRRRIATSHISSLGVSNISVLSTGTVSQADAASSESSWRGPQPA